MKHEGLLPAVMGAYTQFAYSVVRFCMKLPAYFLGHGSPMNAITPNPYAENWRRCGEAVRREYGAGLRAILCVSAHWQTDGLAVTAMPQPRTLHDFGNFPPALFAVRYPASGSPQLAQRLMQLLAADGIAADEGWGLDHGSWGVLCHLFPQADVPVVQLSLNTRLSAREHFQVATKLAPLREEGVLMVGSGNIVHNLRLLDWPSATEAGHGFEWAEQARAWVNQAILARDDAALLNTENWPPAMRLAAPTPEHFLPLLYVLAVCGAEEAVQIFNDDIVGRSLSMTSLAVGAPALQ